MERTAIVQALNQKAVLTSLLFNCLLTYRDTPKGRLFEIEVSDIPTVKEHAKKFKIDLAIKEHQEDGSINIWASMEDFKGSRFYETFEEKNSGELVSSSPTPSRRYEMVFVYTTKFI